MVQNMPGRPTLAEIERRKSNVLSIATDLFAIHGYAATSLAEIARKAGVATRTLYHHFGGKEELFREVISARTANPMGERPRLDEADSLFDMLLRTAHYITESAIQGRAVDLMRLMLAESRRFPELTKKVSDAARDHLVRNVREVFEELAAGHLTADLDHSQSAKLFIDLILGYAPIRHYASWQEDLPSEEEYAEKVRFFIVGRFASEGRAVSRDAKRV